MRFMLGSLSDYDVSDETVSNEMPELERWVLHRLCELDEKVQQGYDSYDFQGVFQAIFTFATVDLSSFYFDIRKDVLYCDGDTIERRSARTVLNLLFHRLTTWLAPILVFTMEEVWLERYPDKDSSVHLVDIPNTPSEWRDDKLAKKWSIVRNYRRLVTSALELQRVDKVIGSSLEAAPTVHVQDKDALSVLESVPFKDICITSDIKLTSANPPKDAYRSSEIDGAAVDFKKSVGTKCERCWKILPDVGNFKHPSTCGRCSTALK